MMEEEIVHFEVDDQVEVLEEYLIEYDEVKDEQESDQLYETEYIDATLYGSRSPKATKSPKTSKRPRHGCHCGKTFASMMRLKNHQQVKHTEIAEEDMFACYTCGKKFKLQSYLEIHIRNIHTENPVKYRSPVSCSICGKVLKSAEALKNHEEMHTIAFLPEDQVKKYSCDLCGMRFRLKGGFLLINFDFFSNF